MEEAGALLEYSFWKKLRMDGCLNFFIHSSALPCRAALIPPNII
jgi:hypothetical protein